MIFTNNDCGFEEVMKIKCLFAGLLMSFWFIGVRAANDVVCLHFNRTGTNAQSVTVDVTDGEGNVIDGVTASLTSSHNLKPTSNAVTASIVCPNVNGNTSPTIELALVLKGLPVDYTFDKIGLDIHALNGGSNYQERADGVVRQWNVVAATNGIDFGELNDIDIAAGVNTGGKTHKVWEMISRNAVVVDGTLTLKLTITKGTTNMGCFFGLSEVVLFTANEVLPEPEPDDEDAKVYYIQWKNTGTNHITENKDNSLSVSAKNTGKMQFWKLIPTGKESCYYIKNVVSGRYIGSCNMTPSSASRVNTSATPVEYYVGSTSATGGEIVGCRYFSSTDCADYANESAGPRALNKDGASDYVITWQASTNRVGSYWNLVETTDTFVKPQHSSVAKSLNIYFNPCGVRGENYLTSAKVHGEGALDRIVYEAAAKPTSWHVPYPHDHGQVVRGATFDISITLKNTPAADLKANAYFDWNADGEFETATPININGISGTANIAVPENATAELVRMRIRINSNGLDLAEDDVEGFVYDFHLTAVEPQEGRTVNVGVNAVNRGIVTLSRSDESYAYGSVLTAKATPVGNATFVCWREEGVVVSTEAEYTFTVDRNMNLKAYFTANTLPGVTGVDVLVLDEDGEVAINVEGDNLVVNGLAEVYGMSLYTIDATLVTQDKGDTLSVEGVSQGTYIVRVTTANGYKNVKIYLNK